MADQKVMGDKMFKEFEYPAEPLGRIFSTQKKFGGKFCPFDDFAFQHEKPEIRMDWIKTFLDCIFDEVSEVLNWLPWKHWKSYKDFQLKDNELRFELIDILHFVVSEALIFNIKPEEMYQAVVKDPTNVWPDQYLDRMVYYSLGSLMMEYKIDPRLPDTNVRVTRDLLRRIIKAVGGAYDYPTHKESYLILFTLLFKLFAVWDMSGRDIYNFYMSKNAENHARQERGY